MVDKTPINSLGMKMRAKNLEQETKTTQSRNSKTHYTGLKIAEQPAEARGSMSNRGTRYQSSAKAKQQHMTVGENDSMSYRPLRYRSSGAESKKHKYTTNNKFLVTFGQDGGLKLSCSKVSNLDMGQEIEEYAEGGQEAYPHIMPASHKKSNTIRFERAYLTTQLSKKLKPGVRVRNVTIEVFREGSKDQDAYITFSFEEGVVTKCQYSDLDAMGSGIFMQTLEIAHSGLNVSEQW